MALKRYLIQNLDCANCAAKIEVKFNALPEVQEATITFATRQLRLTADDPDRLIQKLVQVARTVEDGVEILPWEAHRHQEHAHHEHHHHGDSCGHDHHGDSCGCHGHEHHHDHEHCDCHAHHHDHEHCDCHHDHGHHHEDHHETHHHDHGASESPLGILLGAGLFLLGLALQQVTVFGLSLGLPLFVASYLILGWEVLATAGKNLLKGHVFDENFLMGIATLGAFCIQEFPEAVGVMLFYRVGEYFEHRAVARSRSQIMQAVDLRPETVLRVVGDETVTIPAEEAQVGDLLLVRPGDRIPLDSVVISGESRIDTAPITGEPVPVAVKPGDPVISGCVNTAGQLTVRVEKPLEESMVTRILDSVENAAAGKPKIDRFITRFARIYTPIVVISAGVVAILPSLVTGDWNYWVYTALSFLVMSCPCALVLSVPLAFFSGIGAGSKQGILFKSGLSIEALAGVKAVAMDKTGTVTKGDFSLQEISGDEEMLALCAGCERNSTHPVAVSIVSAATARGLTMPTPASVQEIAGHGIEALVNGTQVLCGNEKLMKKHGISLPAVDTAPGTRVWVARDGVLLGWLRIADTLKADAADAVAQLKALGVATVMLTGDDTSAARSVAQEAGIDEVYARLLPDEKLSTLQSLRKKHGSVMFVGDGINDAPVLSGADVGAAMGTGADAAIEAADVVYLHATVTAIPASLEIAARTRRIAWQNVIFALAIKLAVMILGILGYASMWAAVFADSGVAMLCVLHAMLPPYTKKHNNSKR